MNAYEQIDWPLGDRTLSPSDSYRFTKVENRPYWGIRVEGDMGDNFIWGHIIERLNEHGVPVLSGKFYAEKEPEREPDRTAALTFLAIVG
jgi:hypothetical protein